MKIYSVKDNVMGFEKVFTAANDAAALRMFADTCKVKDNIISEHPEDFSLYSLGELHAEEGIKNAECKFMDKAITYTVKA